MGGLPSKGNGKGSKTKQLLSKFMGFTSITNVTSKVFWAIFGFHFLGILLTFQSTYLLEIINYGFGYNIILT